ncbi:MAG: U32 family peptidase [Prolixibacteraceae bacterium]|nr:U32 family peptidase [Prolixibacteraceae bacterium]
MIGNGYHIVAPVCSAEEVKPLIQAGANEVYFGIMPKSWIGKYGCSDFISRRQSEYAHICDYAELSEIAGIVNDCGCTSTLALNARYSESQMPAIFEILEQWENRGGHSVMVSDLEILLWLEGRKSRLTRQLSVMAGVFNRHSVDFFKQMKVSRMVLPRELSMEEIGRFMECSDESIEYEIITMFQKCEFIDSFCGFYHSVDYRAFVDENYTGLKENLPLIFSCDPEYEGHGCQMEFVCKNRKINHLENHDFKTPFCAACSLETLRNAGVNNFKIAGRGYPPELILRATRFIKQTLDNLPLAPAAIRSTYQSTFGSNCCTTNCYYP